jgi:hypothetical protein
MGFRPLKLLRFLSKSPADYTIVDGAAPISKIHRDRQRRNIRKLPE